MAKEIAHADFILQNFSRFQQEDKYCDLTVVIGNQRFRCHRFVLAASSDYFDSLFNSTFADGTASEISLLGITPSTFNYVFEYMYTGKLTVDLSNAYVVLKTSDFLLMNKLKKSCMKFIEQNPTVNHILKIYNFAISPAGNAEFAKIVVKNAAINFWETIETPEFLNIDSHLLDEIMKEKPNECCFSCKRDKKIGYCLNCLANDGKAEVLFSRFTAWINHRVVERLEYFPQLVAVNLDSKLKANWEESISNYTDELSASFHVLKREYIVLFVITSEINQLVTFIWDKDENFWSEYKVCGKWIDTLRGVLVNQKAYCLCSRTAEDGIINEFWAGDEKMSPLQTPPIFVKEYALTCIKKVIYLYAYDVDLKVETGSSYIYAYIVETNRWFQVNPIPRFLYHSYFVSVDNKLLVIGGSTTYDCETSDTKQNVLQIFNPSTSTWCEKPLKKDLTLKGAACSHNGKVFICEEIITQDEIRTRVIHIYDFTYDEWRTIGLKKNAPAIKSLLYHCNRLWAIPSQSSDNAEVFDLQLKAWCEIGRIESLVTIGDFNGTKEYEIVEILDALIF